MLSQSEIETRKLRRDLLTKTGIGLEFGQSLISDLYTLNSFDSSADKVKQTAAAASSQLNSTYASMSQQDLTKAILGGLSYDTGTVAQVASQRRQLLIAEQNRLNDARSKALTTISDNETQSILGVAAKTLLGVIGWLLL